MARDGCVVSQLTPEVRPRAIPMSWLKHPARARRNCLLTLLALCVCLLASQSLAAQRSSVKTKPQRNAQPAAYAQFLESKTIQATSQAPRSRTILMEVTAYCPCKSCCGKRASGLTASGKRVTHNGGAFVAADTSVLPFHTKVSIPGYRGGRPVPVIDRGGDIVGNRIDVFYPTHKQALQWGRQTLQVRIDD